MRAGPPVRRTKRQKSQKMNVQKVWDSCAQDKTSEISKHALSGILGLLCAEQNVGNLKNCTFRKSGSLVCAEQNVENPNKMHVREFGNSGTPVRRTKRQTSQEMHFCNFWDSCAQDKTSEISTIALSGILGLLYAEQDVGNLNKCPLTRALCLNSE